MKQILTLLITTMFISVHSKAQIAQQRTDTLLDLAGQELQKYSKLSNAGYLLTTSGTIVMVVGAMSPIKSTVKNVTTTKPNGALIVIGGFLYLCGMGCLLSAPGRVNNAGYFFKLISGQKVEIPLKKKK